jgi:hypothetical protein
MPLELSSAATTASGQPTAEAVISLGGSSSGDGGVSLAWPRGLRGLARQWWRISPV